VLVEQAIFTSARTGRSDGYQVVAHSPAVTESEVRELSAWGPSHGALTTSRGEAFSINFHRMSSGRYCISKTDAAGREYSDRGGARIYTHFLLVHPEVFARFANNAFTLLRAAWAKGVLAVHHDRPATLEAFPLVGRSSIVDDALLTKLRDHWGPSRVGRLVAAAVSPGLKLLVGAEQSETLFGGLINCFPLQCRTELSFTTALRYSPRRPYRFATLDSDPTAIRQAARHEGVTIIDLRDESGKSDELAGWAAYVAAAMAGDQLTLLASELRKSRPELALEQLDELGTELLRELGSDSAAIGACIARWQDNSARLAPSEAFRSFRSQFQQPAAGSAGCDDGESIATAAVKSRQPHRRPALAGGTSLETRTVTDDATIELFEQLDDAVYDCIHGALEIAQHIADLWSKLSEQLQPDVLAAASEQYLRYSRNLWDVAGHDGSDEPQRSSTPLDVLTALFGPDPS